MAQTNPAVADPVSNAVLSPEASRFTRDILENALDNPPAASASWRPTAHALLANVLMNDVMNSWNSAGQGEISDAQTHVDEAINANPPNPVMALAQHAQGLIHRATEKLPRCTVRLWAGSEFERRICPSPGAAGKSTGALWRR